MRVIDAVEQPSAVAELLRRDPFVGFEHHAEAAAKVVADVRQRGDAAVIEIGRQFDCPTLTAAKLKVPASAFENALAEVAPAFKTAAETAIANLRDFHQRQVRQDWIASRPGGWVGQRTTPFDRVGLYIPGGAAVLCSTLLHLAVPAQVAGVRDLLVCTPARADGSAEKHLLACAALLEVDQLYLAGGAAAIAAMAMGTATIPKVDFIAGPGSPFVNHAKRLVFGLVGIDSLAGASEILIVADDSASPKQVAADLLSQAEHPDGRAVLLTPSAALARDVEREVAKQLAGLPTKPIAQVSLEKYGAIVHTKDLAQAIELCNEYAPEHLELLLSDPMSWLDRVRNAGAIFLGAYSPEPLGDYLAGPSHVLPTDGTARFASPVGVDTFRKRSSLIAYGRETLAAEAASIATFARAEGLEAHARSIEARGLSEGA